MQLLAPPHRSIVAKARLQRTGTSRKKWCGCLRGNGLPIHYVHVTDESSCHMWLRLERICEDGRFAVQIVDSIDMASRLSDIVVDDEIDRAALDKFQTSIRLSEMMHDNATLQCIRRGIRSDRWWHQNRPRVPERLPSVESKNETEWCQFFADYVRYVRDGMYQVLVSIHGYREPHFTCRAFASPPLIDQTPTYRVVVEQEKGHHKCMLVDNNRIVSLSTKDGAHWSVYFGGIPYDVNCLVQSMSALPSDANRHRPVA